VDPVPVDATWGPPALVLTTVLSLAQAWLWLSIGLPLWRDLATGIRFVVAGVVAALMLGMAALVRSIVLGGWTQDDVELVGRLDALAYMPLLAIYGGLLIVAAEHARRPARQGMALWLVVLPGAVEPALYVGEAIGDVARFLGSTPRPPITVYQFLSLSELVLYPAALAWGLRATGGPHGRSARNLALGMLACVLLALAVGAAPGMDMQRSGIGGIVLIAAALLALWGLLRYGLLGRDPGKPLLSPTTLAAIGLAALFMTAQVAQNFLSDALGLLAGGIVAGAAVFAAYPIQRAAERTMERNVKRGPADEYRALVEHAWSDGSFGPKERLMLSETRRRLGIDAEAAQTIEDEVARRARHGD
jgi:hypothetical protein